jgi:hypothetical protein
LRRRPRPKLGCGAREGGGGEKEEEEEEEIVAFILRDPWKILENWFPV